MKVEYFPDTDTLHIEVGPGEVSETRAVDENTRIDMDAAGNVCAIAIAHARERAEVWTLDDSIPAMRATSDVLEMEKTRLIEQLREETAGRERAEEAFRNSERRLERQNAAFVELARGMRRQREWRGRLRAITEASAKALEVERVSIWLLNADRTQMECADIYELSKKTHSAGAVLAAADYPAYFRALNQERTIAAHDAHEDPRTEEFSASYLTHLGITSMLDAPMRLGGRVRWGCLPRAGGAAPRMDPRRAEFRVLRGRSGVTRPRDRPPAPNRAGTLDPRGAAATTEPTGTRVA